MSSYENEIKKSIKDVVLKSASPVSVEKDGKRDNEDEQDAVKEVQMYLTKLFVELENRNLNDAMLSSVLVYSLLTELGWDPDLQTGFLVFGDDDDSDQVPHIWVECDDGAKTDLHGGCHASRRIMIHGTVIDPTDHAVSCRLESDPLHDTEFIPKRQRRHRANIRYVKSHPQEYLEDLSSSIFAQATAAYKAAREGDPAVLPIIHTEPDKLLASQASQTLGHSH